MTNLYKIRSDKPCLQWRLGFSQMESNKSFPLKTIPLNKLFGKWWYILCLFRAFANFPGSLPMQSIQTSPRTPALSSLKTKTSSYRFGLVCHIYYVLCHHWHSQKQNQKQLTKTKKKIFFFKHILNGSLSNGLASCTDGLLLTCVKFNPN